MSIPHPEIPVGGRLKHFYNEWSSITSDKYILSMIHGLQLNLTEFPAQTSIAPPLKFNAEEAAATDKLVLELLEKNAIAECNHEDGYLLAGFFLGGNQMDPSDLFWIFLISTHLLP